MKNVMFGLAFVLMLIGIVSMWGSVAFGLGYFIYSLVKLDVGFLSTVGSSVLVTLASAVFGFISWALGYVLSNQL